MRKVLISAGIVTAFVLSSTVTTQAAAAGKVTFTMVPSAGAASCLSSSAHAVVTIKDVTQGQKMHVELDDLPPKTSFALFVIQVPNKPFGLVWYQGDLDTNRKGHGAADFIGIFSDETFIMAPGVAAAPKVFDDDATSNPATAPIQTYHLGIWFADPTEAANAGCPGTVTQFDGDHVAGIQVLNTGNFADDHGPLLDLK